MIINWGMQHVMGKSIITDVILKEMFSVTYLDFH